MSSAPKNWQPIVLNGESYVYKFPKNGEIVMLRKQNTEWDSKNPDLPHWSFEIEFNDENYEVVVVITFDVTNS